jgi:sterol 3beta-glucosyltransferase
MRILICAVGSLGDVAPYTGLGTALRAAGHEVTIAGYDEHRHFVECRGLPFRSVPGSSRAMFDSERGRRWQRNGTGPVGMARGHLLHVPNARTLVQGLVAAAEPGADLLLLSGSSILGHHVAEALDVPSVGVFLQPIFPSRELPPWTAGFGRSLGGFANKNLALVAAVSLALKYDGALKEIRAELGLPPLNTPAARRSVQQRIQRACFGFSPSVVPRPDDWPETAEVAGYWWPEPVPGWEPPAQLVDFLAAGPPPVYVGFGSVTRPGGVEVQVDVIRAALRRAGVRGLIHAAAGGNADDDKDDILTLTEPVPHEWLFPRTAAAVHHAAAGTTAASLRAGRPVVPVPIATDHPFWADRLVRLGVSAGSVPVRALSEQRLAHAIRAVVDDPRYVRTGEELAARIEKEDGAAMAVHIIERLVQLRSG